MSESPVTESTATGPPRGPSEGHSVTLEAVDIRKSFTYGEGSELHVLEGVNLLVGPGEAVAVTGSSGAGKSTLLHILGALDRPSSGEVRVGGQRVSDLDDGALAGARNRHIGFVFQFHHLLREFNAVENVMMPMLIAGAAPARARARARELLDAVGLAERMEHRPWQLSGGEQQRVAVARALSNEPTVLLADEPSGNLDHSTSQRLHELIFTIRRDRDLAAMADRILMLEDGVLKPSSPT